MNLFYCYSPGKKRLLSTKIFSPKSSLQSCFQFAFSTKNKGFLSSDSSLKYNPILCITDLYHRKHSNVNKNILPICTFPWNASIFASICSLKFNHFSLLSRYWDKPALEGLSSFISLPFFFLFVCVMVQYIGNNCNVMICHFKWQTLWVNTTQQVISSSV